MQTRLPQSVAIRIPLKAYLASDHLTEATGKTIPIVISKNGAGFANPAAGATNAAAIELGWYYVNLGTDDLDTLGPLIIRGTEATIDNVEICFQVVSATNLGASNLDAAISSRATQTSVDAIGIVGTEVAYAPTAGVRTVGDNDGGAYTDLAAHDEVNFDTGENASGLTVEVTCGASTTSQIPSYVRVSGNYSGSGTHSVNVLIYNYTISAFVSVGTMLNKNLAFDYTFPMTSDNQHLSTGEMKIKFVHSVVAYNSSHVLHLDYISFRKQTVDSATASNIAAIKVQTDKMNFTGTDILATLDSETVVVATNNDKTGYELTVTPPTAVEVRTEIDANSTKLDATVSSRSTVTSADVLTQVNAALDATDVELSTVPATIASLRDRIKFLFQYFKLRRTATTAVETLYKDNSSTALGTATISNNGTTVDRGKMT